MDLSERPITVDELRKVVHVVTAELLSFSDEPIPPFEHHNKVKLAGALAAPFQTAFGEYIYSDIAAKAAALLYFIAKDHPFGNGNKRIAVVTMIYYLLRNGYSLNMTTQDLYRLAVDMVGDNRLKDDMMADLTHHIRSRMSLSDDRSE